MTAKPLTKLFKRSGRKMIAVSFYQEDVKALRKKNKELQEQLDEHHDAILKLCRAIDKDQTRQAAQTLIDLLPTQ